MIIRKLLRRGEGERVELFGKKRKARFDEVMNENLMRIDILALLAFLYFFYW